MIKNAPPALSLQQVKVPSSPLFLKTIIYVLLMIITGTFGCQSKANTDGIQGEPDNGGLSLPGGFEAVVVADSIGRARHIAVNNNGDIYVKLRPNEDGIVALRDTDNDGKADIISAFGDYPNEGGGTGMAIYNHHLYLSNSGGVYRYELTPGRLLPEGEAQIVIAYDYRNATHGSEHSAKPITFDGEGNMYIPFGSPSDVCQEENRVFGSPGQDPCPELEEYAGIWQFDPNKLEQGQNDGVRYATGIRSVTAFDWNHADNTLYVVQHGRDYLVRMFPEVYSSWESALLPSEEFMRVTEGSDFGWPYCYFDQLQNKRVLNPEYGGDGNIVERCDEFDRPLIGFSGHWAPNDLLFYTGDQFPDRYKNGAFIAFHGSTTREGYPQAGYTVIFVPFENGEPTGDWEVFANGFAGHDPLVNQSDAEHRPMGLATGPDGSLYITDSIKGKIWRVMYNGDKNNFNEEHLARMEEVKRTASNIRTPHEEDDYLMVNEEIATIGEGVFRSYCAVCHQNDGGGSFPRYPPLSRTDWVTGNKERLINIIANGLEGPIEVKGEQYDFPMPPHNFLSDREVAGVATYIRQNFQNDASDVTVEEVEKFRIRSN